MLTLRPYCRAALRIAARISSTPPSPTTFFVTQIHLVRAAEPAGAPG
ncbi:hypothetical protein ACFYM2_25565 [Streptomyces sp. NPDC006711]